MSNESRSAVKNLQEIDSAEHRDAFDSIDEERISKFLNSENFLSYLHSFDDSSYEDVAKFKSKIIGMALEYLMIHPDGYMLSDYLKCIKDNLNERSYVSETPADKKELTSFIIKSIASKLRINEPEELWSRQTQGKINDHIEKTLRYRAHAFNGVFEEGIRATGLSTEERLWSVGEVKRIDLLFKNKLAYEYALGLLNSVRDKDEETYFAGSHNNIYSYASESPEWFLLFLQRIGYDNNDKTRSAFARRDYQTAKTNFLKGLDDSRKIAIDYPDEPLTDDEYKEIVDFFEKYWAMFTAENSTPKVALIREGALGINRLTFDVEMDNVMDGDFKRLMEYRIFMESIDDRTDIQIKPEDLKIIDLPEFVDVFPER